jgi:hypothetical protein
MMAADAAAASAPAQQRLEALLTRLRHRPSDEAALAELLALLKRTGTSRPDLVAKYGFKHAVLHRRSLGDRGKGQRLSPMH